ncbi:uncharacterized protein DNG_05018 [Cephalotrichum gorgonifer]|uniref:Uncharacterized protein n=1 Tax=Cephalotrichum gorgonifer TaxID=2041049 RepID=A0AAE8MXQ6_9PEZI|nr:uncharacterized protein DNG_05018 [Cephalotrichum gorgonifer]
MAPLRVPEDGLLLSGSPGDNHFPSQAFAITLSDDIIGDLIRCAQNGEDIQLSLGSSPSLQYGSSSQTIPRSTDTTLHDFYLTQPFSESIKRARKVQNTMSIFSKPKILAQTGQYSLPKARPKPGAAAKGKAAKEKAKLPTKPGVSPSLDSGIEALQNSLAQAESNNNQTLLIDGLAGTKKGKSNLLSSMARASPTPRSMPGSPAFSATGGSPSLGPVLSASQQAIERGKGQRVSIIHELAAQDQTYDYLESKWTGKPEEFAPTLRKVAEFNEGTQKWVMAKTFWKELDVWNYEYESQDARQHAIDNAVRQYDKMRVTPSQPQWERLLPKEERGKGKCLSRLQANLTRGPGAMAQAAPKIKVQNADEGATDSGREDNDTKSVGMSRSASNPLPAKKKISDREAQQKRLLSGKSGAGAGKTGSTTAKAGNVTTKAGGAAAKASSPRVSLPKTVSPTKGKSQGAKANGGSKVLSQEFVVDSDSDSEDQILATKATRPMRDLKEAAPALAAHAATAINAVAASKAQKPKPKPKQPLKSAEAKSATKRQRDDDADDSSSSGMPLSKRVKQKPTSITAAAPVIKHRQSDSSQNSRGSSTGVSYKSYKSKNATSPTKSSPLASSPPTNASDLDIPEDTISARPAMARKRPLEREREMEREKPRERETPRDREKEKPRTKKPRADVPNDLYRMAHAFKLFYEKYEELHWEISALENPPREKVADLVDMRDRLQNMKSEIYRSSAERD